MKRILMVTVLVTVMLFAGTAMAQMPTWLGGSVKAGVDFAGIYAICAGPCLDENTTVGAHIGAELYYKAHPNIDVGGGLQYHFQRTVDVPVTPAPKFWFLPIYGVVRVHVMPGQQWDPYFIGQFGYNFHGGNAAFTSGADVKGGLYWAAGGGVIFMEHYLLEVVYAEHRGDSDIGLLDLDLKYRRIGVSAGYNF